MPYFIGLNCLYFILEPLFLKIKIEASLYFWFSEKYFFPPESTKMTTLCGYMFFLCISPVSTSTTCSPYAEITIFPYIFLPCQTLGQSCLLMGFTEWNVNGIPNGIGMYLRFLEYSSTGHHIQDWINKNKTYRLLIFLLKTTTKEWDYTLHIRKICLNPNPGKWLIYGN